MPIHKVNGKELKVSLYYECLGSPKSVSAVEPEPEPDPEITAATRTHVTATPKFSSGFTARSSPGFGPKPEVEPKFPEPVVFKGVDPISVQFLKNADKHKIIIEEELKKLGGTLVWPNKTDMPIEVKWVTEYAGPPSVRQWVLDVRECVQNFLTKYEVDTVPVGEDKWKEVGSALEGVDVKSPDDVFVFMKKESWCIVLAGVKVSGIVGELKKQICDICARVEQEQIKAKTMKTERKSLNRSKLLLMRELKFAEDIEKAFTNSKMTLDVGKGEIVIEGPVDLVDKILVKMYETIASFCCRHFKLSKSRRKLLQQKTAQKHIKELLKRKKIIAVWDLETDNEDVDMHSLSDQDVDAAVDLLKQHLIEKQVKLDDGRKDIVHGREWRKMADDLEERYYEKILICEDRDVVLVAATSDVFDKSFDSINDFFDTHDIREEFVAVEAGVFQVIKKYHWDEIGQEEEKLGRLSVRVTPEEHTNRTGFKILGPQQKIALLIKKIRELAEDVEHHKHEMKSKHGIHELFTSTKGTERLKEIESREKCIIVPELVQRAVASASNSDTDEEEERKKRSFAHSQRQRKNSKRDLGKMKIVYNGVLAKHRADALVNSVSSDLDLEKGGLSKSLLTAGGQTLQTELQQNYGGIQPGQHAVTTGGNLDCRQIFHVCLPPWDGNKGQALQTLESIVSRCLIQADGQSLRSIAFPALGTGRLKYPADKVAKVMLDCVQKFEKQKPGTSIRTVDIVLHHKDPSAVKAFHALESGEEYTHSSSGGSKSFRMGSLTVEVLQGNITKERSDVIVSHALPKMSLAKGGVLAKTIVTAAGSDVEEEFSDEVRDAEGEKFVATSGGSLPCKEIFHLLLGGKTSGQDWEKSLIECLEEVENRGHHSVSMPALGAGKLGRSPDAVARTMFSAVRTFATSGNVHSMRRVRFVIFQEDMLDVFLNVGSGNNPHTASREHGRRGAHGGSNKGKEEILVLHVYSTSSSSFPRIRAKLEGMLKTEIVDKSVFAPIKLVEGLKDKQVEKMKAMGKDGDVTVRVDKSKGNITLHGVQYNVVSVQEKLQGYVRNIEKDYKDLQEKKHREKIAMEKAGGALPKSWAPMKPTETLKVVQMTPQDVDYTKVANAFGAGRAVANIVSIERIQNQYLYKQYLAKKKQMEAANAGSKFPVERQVWHGTPSPQIVDNINQNGFNRSYCNSPSNGAGVYFSPHVATSIGYSRGGVGGHKHIYFVYALTGDMCVGSHGIKTPPPKNPAVPHVFYDSTCDNPQNPNEIIIFHDSQAYPAYHITYT